MEPTQAQNIDEVIEILEGIIQSAETHQNSMGYFAALYKRVTLQVKKGIEEGFFEDNKRMEALDVIFANRYLAAYFAYQNQQPNTLSWIKAFDLTKQYWPIVLQHLLIGMNAHINLDLGIAAATVSKGKDIKLLQGDFNKINQILSELVKKVEDELSLIWPPLKWILDRTRKIDQVLVDFSMELARDGAWKFATQLADTAPENWVKKIKERDEKVARKADIVTNPGFFVKALLRIVRLGERGSVSARIQELDSLY